MSPRGSTDDTTRVTPLHKLAKASRDETLTQRHRRQPQPQIQDAKTPRYTRARKKKSTADSLTHTLLSHSLPLTHSLIHTHLPTRSLCCPTHTPTLSLSLSPPPLTHTQRPTHTGTPACLALTPTSAHPPHHSLTDRRTHSLTHLSRSLSRPHTASKVHPPKKKEKKKKAKTKNEQHLFAEKRAM